MTIQRNPLNVAKDVGRRSRDSLVGSRGVRDPEIRWSRATRQGRPSSFAPGLGPCLMYIGADNGNGYGQFRYNGANGYAHRYAWERVNGPIPEGLTVDHLCRVRKCVNVEHLELVDGPTNTRRAAATRTRCKNGHEYTDENTRIRRGRRECIVCDKKAKERSGFKRTIAYLGTPDSRLKYDQAVMADVISAIRKAEMTIAQGARAVGCNPNYLGRRVWEETKRAVLDRDECCALCQSRDSLDVHHRHARGAGGSANSRTSFGMDNLITLCRIHHREVEANPDWARSVGLRVDAGQDPLAVPVMRNGQSVLLDDAGGIRPVGGAA